MRRLPFFAVLLCLPLSPAAFASEPDLSWMAGNWRQCDAGGGSVEEHWLGPQGGMLVGANLTTTGGRTSFEYLRIAQQPDGWTYFASPGGKPPTPFRLTESGPSRAVFANPANDFPTRIIYARDGADLTARIEGRLRGQDRAESWRFVRIVGEGGCKP